MSSERNAAFESGDIGWMEEQFPNPRNPGAVEIAFHKARFECTDVSDRVRQYSREWLDARGLTRWDGSPLPNKLPRRPLYDHWVLRRIANAAGTFTLVLFIIGLMLWATTL